MCGWLGAKGEDGAAEFVAERQGDVLARHGVRGGGEGREVGSAGPFVEVGAADAAEGWGDLWRSASVVSRSRMGGDGEGFEE